MSKEIIKQFGGGVYKFVICDYRSLAIEGGVRCGKIHIYEKRIMQLEPPKVRWIHIGDLRYDDSNTPTPTMEQNSGNTRQLSSDGESHI